MLAGIPVGGDVETRCEARLCYYNGGLGVYIHIGTSAQYMCSQICIRNNMYMCVYKHIYRVKIILACIYVWKVILAGALHGVLGKALR